MRALVYVNPLCCVVESCILYRIVRNAVISVSILFSTGHLYTFIQFQIRFKTRLHD